MFIHYKVATYSIEIYFQIDELLLRKRIVIATKSIVKIKMYYVFKWKTAFKLMRARGRQI